MPSTDATLAWALQVDVQHLGANLEAYVDLLATFNTLRLCNRFGTGPEARITRLPPELISIVEDFMLLEERSNTSKAWCTDFKCYQQLCIPEDHLTSEEYDVRWQKARVDNRYIWADSDSDSEAAEEEFEGLLCNMLEDEFKTWSDVHCERICSWRSRVEAMGMRTIDMFTAYSKLINAHFGLDVWISQVRLEHYLSLGLWEDMEFGPPQTTVAYLVLPGAKTTRRNGNLTMDEVDTQEFVVQCGYGVPAHILPPLSESARNRFKRMVQILDLRPWRSRYQMDQDSDRVRMNRDSGRAQMDEEDEIESHMDAIESHINGYIEGGTKTAALELPVEPHLTMLIKTTVSSDESG